MIFAKCPECKCQGGEDDFDVIGACNNNVFCQQCHCEFDPGTGKVHKCNTSAEQAAINRESGVSCVGRKRGPAKKRK